MAGVTDGGAEEVVLGAYNGKLLILPAGWRLTPPVPEERGEPVGNYQDRVIYAYPLVQDILALGAGDGLKPPPPLDGPRPADCTVQWWLKEYPCLDAWAAMGKTWKERLEYKLALVVWRLRVELFDRLRSGDWVASGHRNDLPTRPFEPVPREIWQHPAYVLRPSAGLLLAEPSLPGFLHLRRSAAEPVGAGRRPIAASSRRRRRSAAAASSRRRSDAAAPNRGTRPPHEHASDKG